MSSALTVALPAGRVRRKSAELMRCYFGIDVASDGMSRRRVWNLPTMQVQVVRIADAAMLMKEGLLDICITSDDWIAEYELDCVDFGSTEWWHTDMVVAAPESESRVRDCLVTEYPRLTRRLLDSRQIPMANPATSRIVAVRGGAEGIAAALDALVVECSETGRSLKENHMDVVQSLFPSSPRVVVSSAAPSRAASVAVALLSLARQPGSQ